MARPGKAQIGNFNSKSSAYYLGLLRALRTITVLRNGAESNSAGALPMALVITKRETLNYRNSLVSDLTQFSSRRKKLRKGSAHPVFGSTFID
jgi:hypothetical protein